MKSIVLTCLLLAMVSFSSHTHAQVAGCAPGDILSTAGGVSTCLPGSAPPPEPEAPQPVQPKWESRWGAIATDANKGVIGSSIGMSNESLAKSAAMDDCHKKGGIDCVLQMPFSNGCAALIVGDTVFNVIADKTSELAAQVGIKQCSKDSTNCRVYFMTCSPAVRVR